MKINNLRRNTLLALSAISCTGSAMAQSKAEQQKKYNVIFIASDDLANTMETFNNPMVKTPNLDKLAERGVVFNYAHNQFPLSGPSRASLMTGLRPDKTKVFNLDLSFRANNPDAQTLPELFKNNGYYTARVGKIFHAGVPGDIGKDGQDDPQSWVDRYNPIGRDKTEEHLVTIHTPQRKILGSTLAFMSMDAADAELTDGMVANVTVKLMRDALKKQKEPFFIAAGFYRPHCPYIAPKKYFDMYPIDKIEMPEQRDDDWDDKPEAAKFTDPLHWGMTVQQQKEVLQSYYASITFMDAQVGTILDGVKELGLEDNTIIVFWSDHGYNTGHHGQWMKQSLFDQVSRTPLLISIPGMKSNGKETDNHVEFVDIYPTIAEACGIQTPSNVQGVNLAPILNNTDINWDRPAFTQLQRVKKIAGSDEKKTFFGRSVRYGDLRYTEWDEGNEGIELYDYSIDPNEFTNFANNKKYKKDQEKLKTMLRNSYTK